MKEINEYTFDFSFWCFAFLILKWCQGFISGSILEDPSLMTSHYFCQLFKLLQQSFHCCAIKVLQNKLSPSDSLTHDPVYSLVIYWILYMYVIVTSYIIVDKAGCISVCIIHFPSIYIMWSQKSMSKSNWIVFFIVSNSCTVIIVIIRWNFFWYLE